EAFGLGERAPFFVVFVRAVDGDVPGKKIGVKAHVGRAARVGVVAQADELGARPGAELDNGGNVSALKFGAKDDDEVFLRSQFVAQLFQRVVGSIGAGERAGGSVITVEESN